MQGFLLPTCIGRGGVEPPAGRGGKGNPDCPPAEMPPPGTRVHPVLTQNIKNKGLKQCFRPNTEQLEQKFANFDDNIVYNLAEARFDRCLPNSPGIVKEKFDHLKT